MPTDLLQYSQEDLLAWAGRQAWADRMRSTPQDRRFHSEGDVWAHTLGVCERLMDLPAWQKSPEPDRALLFLAAILHDIGKPAVTEERPTGVVAPNHGPVGRRLVRRVLIREPVDYRHRELIASLVRFHTTPPTITRRIDPSRTIINVSWRSRPDLLYLLAIADGRGRNAAEAARFLDRVEQFRALGLELQCFTEPFRFASDEARFRWFRNALPDPYHVPEEQYRCEITMLAGLPGAGKDYWYRKNAADLPMVGLDAIRTELGVSWTDDQAPVIREAERRFHDHIDRGEDFVYNATNINRAARRKWTRIVRHRGARLKIVYLEPPLNVIKRQNRRREAVVDEDVIDQYVEKLEVPERVEAHEVIWA